MPKPGLTDGNAAHRVRLLERSVAESEASLRHAMHRMDEAERATDRGSWEWDVATNRATWSKGMYRLFGVDAATFQNTNDNFLAMVHPDDRQRMQGAMAAALQSPGRFYQEYRFIRADGELRHLRGEGNVVADTHGNARMMYGFVQDVTQAKNTEQELHELKARFMDIMAHDLNNVLSPMAINVKMLGDELTKAGHGDSKSLQRLQRNVERIGGLLADMLDACRMQSGQLAITPQDFDLAASLREAFEEMRLQAARQGIAAQAQVIGALAVRADRRRIEQVTTNLISNALKFTPPGGTVTLGLEATGTDARIWVKDTGQGLAPESIPLLFRPFSRIGSVSQGGHTGTGLGLFICHGIVARHGGRIWCESAGIGKGTTFTFTIPFGPGAGSQFNS